MTASPKKTTAQLARELNDAVRAKIIDSLQGVESRVTSIVDRHASSLVASALGMEMRFGEWSVDHCNGRRTSIADEIGRLAFAHVKASIEEWCKPLQSMKPPKGWKDGLRREFEEQFHRALRDMTRDRIATAARAAAEKELTDSLTDILREPPPASATGGTP